MSIRQLQGNGYTNNRCFYWAYRLLNNFIHFLCSATMMCSSQLCFDIIIYLYTGLKTCVTESTSNIILYCNICRVCDHIIIVQIHSLVDVVRYKYWLQCRCYSPLLLWLLPRMNSSRLRSHHELLNGFLFTLFGIVHDTVSCFGCFKT